MNNLSDLNISPNQPLYLYQCPMFLLTVSTVVLIENGVILIEDETYKFPCGIVKAGQETIQFAAIRYLKEQTGITLKKDILIPVDFRSSPDRSKEGNIVDIGFVCVVENVTFDYIKNDRENLKWAEIDFEKKCLVDRKIKFHMDHNLLLERAIEIIDIFLNRGENNGQS